MNHCRNRGFVLDGYPRNFKEAENLAKKEKKAEVSAEEDESKPKEFEIDSEILPHSVIVFRASTSFLLERIHALKHVSHEFNQERMERRLRLYKEDIELSEKSVFDYYSDLNTEIFECECNEEEVEIIENLKIYIEREGRPYNFLASVQEMQESRRRFIEERNLENAIKNEADRKKEEEIENNKMIQREKQAQQRFFLIKQKFEESYGLRSIPLRKYLMENVMPSLAEALIHVCKVMPEDPVDYVSELIYSQSKRYRK